VGRRAAEKLLSVQERPTALFVANSEMTAGALSAPREQKIRIPDEISLVGFDDARWAQFSDPPLTIVAQPTSAMGKRSAELLLAMIQKEKETATEVFPPELVIRASTAAPR
jgi:LacI family transcriptional regulator